MKQNTNCYMVYQLPHSNQNVFRSFEDVPQPINIGDYCCVWANDDVEFDMDDRDICEELFTRFNVAHPKGFGAHSMSVSDIIVIFRGEESRLYYCDPVGFKKINYFK